MSDYYKPMSIKESHKRIDELLRINKLQADEIGMLKSEIHNLKLEKAIAIAEKETFKIKWKRVLNMHLGLKAVLASLSSNSDDFEDYEQLNKEGE